MATRTTVSHPIQVVERYLGQLNVERLKAVGVTLITAAITVAWGLVLISQVNNTGGHAASRTIWDHPRQPDSALSITTSQPVVDLDTVDMSAVGPSSTILAANPELAIARRYATMLEWRRLHHPGR